MNERAPYVNVRSVTFWAGASSVVLGGALGVHDVMHLGQAGDLVRAWVGPVGPHVLISNGFGLIGLRRAVS